MGNEMVGAGKVADYLLFSAVLCGVLALSARVLRRVEVVGDSMLPGLRAGDRLLVARGLPVRPGHVVLLRDPRDGSRPLLKRVTELSSEGLLVEGDNPAASTDGRHFGAVSRGSVTGRALYRYHPPDRVGLVHKRGL